MWVLDECEVKLAVIDSSCNLAYSIASAALRGLEAYTIGLIFGLIPPTKLSRK